MMRKPLLRALQGGLLAAALFGVTLPFALDPRAIWDAESIAFVVYLAVGSSVAFTWFSWRLGQREEELEAALQKADVACITDQGTGLRNSRCFRRTLQDACSEASEGEQVSLVIFDLDDFKQVNDRFGHAVGDFALRLAATALASQTRGGDTAARVGGEELAVILPGANEAEAKLVADRILEEIRQRGKVLPQGCKLTASAGIATATRAQGQRLHARALFRRADSALYAAKKAGKDRAVVAGETQRCTSSGLLSPQT